MLMMHWFFPVIVLVVWCPPSNAFSASSTGIATVQAELIVSVGRIPGTDMPPEWAASGAKLGFQLDVKFTDEVASHEMTKEHLMLKGDALEPTLLSVEPLNNPTFITNNGTQTIDVEGGAYGYYCQMEGLESSSKQYALRFFLDFPRGAMRNDVELPAERIFFLTSCWLSSSPENNNELDRARKRKEQFEQEIELIDARTNKIRSQELASNILGNVIQRAFNLRHLLVLAGRRNKLQGQLKEVEREYPLDSSGSAGVIQGPNDVIYAKEGVIAVKRLKGAMGTQEEYCWVGTFAIHKFFGDN